MNYCVGIFRGIIRNIIWHHTIRYYVRRRKTVPLVPAMVSQRYGL